MVKRGKVLCDSNIVINLFDRRGKQYEQALKSIASIGMDNLLISAITEMKVIKGIRNKEHEHQVLKKLEKTHIIALDGNIGARTVELLRKYHLSHGLHILDAPYRRHGHRGGSAPAYVQHEGLPLHRGSRSDLTIWKSAGFTGFAFPPTPRRGNHRG